MLVPMYPELWSITILILPIVVTLPRMVKLRLKRRAARVPEDVRLIQKAEYGTLIFLSFAWVNLALSLWILFFPGGCSPAKVYELVLGFDGMSLFGMLAYWAQCDTHVYWSREKIIGPDLFGRQRELQWERIRKMSFIRDKNGVTGICLTHDDGKRLYIQVSLVGFDKIEPELNRLAKRLKVDREWDPLFNYKDPALLRAKPKPSVESASELKIARKNKK